MKLRRTIWILLWHHFSTMQVAAICANIFRYTGSPKHNTILVLALLFSCVLWMKSRRLMISSHRQHHHQQVWWVYVVHAMDQINLPIMVLIRGSDNIILNGKSEWYQPALYRVQLEVEQGKWHVTLFWKSTIHTYTVEIFEKDCKFPRSEFYYPTLA